MTSKWVINQVITKKYHCIMKAGGSVIAFFAKANKNKSQANNSQSSYNPNKKCLYCNRKGHNTSEC